MSQVIVTNDKLRAKREKSRDQEHKIEVNEISAKWRRSDITGPDPVAKLVGLAVLPILGLWSILAGLMTVIIVVVNFVFKGLGQLIGGSKDLIRGA